MDVKRRRFLITSIAIAILLLAIASPYITYYNPNEQDLAKALLAPCKEHLLGTDRYGRDMLARVLVGARYSVFSTLFLVITAALTGTIVGMVSGYFGGRIDYVLMRACDMFLSIPSMVFAIAVAGVLGGGINNAVLALLLIAWPKYARLARTQVLSEKNNTYIEAAILNGNGMLRILFIQILPNIVGTMMITATLDIGTMMMELAGLSFLGLGAMPPTPEWGSMMSNGRSMIQTSPWVILSPGAAIFITVMVFNLLGDSYRDLMDCKQRKREIYN